MGLKTGSLRNVSSNIFAIPDPTAEYIADDLSGPDGTTVQSWSPSTGSISLDGGDPTIEVDALNNRNVLVGDGSDDALAATSSLSNNEEMTAYVVAEPARDSGSGYILGNDISSGTGTNPSITTYFNQPLEYLDGTGNLNTISTTNDGFAIIGFVRSKPSNTVTVRYNGSSVIDTTFNDSPSTDFNLTAFNDNQQSPANSGISHIYVKNRPLEQSEFEALESYLSDLYGISLA